VSFIFQINKEKAFREYRREHYTVAFDLINNLEDKHINGVVCYKLAYMHFNGKGVPKDVQKGQELFKKSYPLMGSSSLELFYKGIMNKEGRGIDKNYDLAFSFYKRSSDMGFVQAHINLGSCFREGHGVERDLKEAFRCFKMAADKKSPLGLCHVGYMYEFGLGTELNLVEAKNYYNLSAARRNNYARNRLKLLE